MRALIQRVSSASVTVDQKKIAHINHGLLVFLGIEERDSQADIDWLSGKIARLRLFADHDDLMNLSLIDTAGSVLVVSQFTLHANTKKGNRPSFIRAARPEQALPLYKAFLSTMETHLKKSCQAGEFGANMQVELINDGPVTLFIDSHDRQ